MRAGRRWIVAIAALIGIALTLRLGFWQLGRAHEKEALAAAIERSQALPPMDERQLAAARLDDSLLHRPVELRGEWISAHTVYLDNRQMAGRQGFYVVTPLRLHDDARSVVLVQRGWAPRNFNDRTALPPVQTPRGPVVVMGRLAPPPAKLYEFDGAPMGPIRQNLDLAAFRAETKLPLMALSVQALGAASDGLARDWPQPASGAGKNYGYAFQWWALAALIALLYVWFQFIVPARRRTGSS